MAMIRCPECRREVSDRANSCPSCGCPIGGGGSFGNEKFERRIDEYKRHGYKLQKRVGDTAKMYKLNAKFFILCLVFSSLPFIYIFLLINVFDIQTQEEFILYIFPVFIGSVVSLLLSIRVCYVNITITKTGKIEETGNVLKNK